MGCSSSSAQTVDQEKRPGTKPEESNGDTLAVKNGIIAEDATTIEDQMQLPVQTALPDDCQPGGGDETEEVLMALEAQEDLGSGEDLLAVSEPQPEPAACEEPAQETAASAPAEDSAEPEAAVAVDEASVETILEEAPPVAEVLVEATEKADIGNVAEEVVAIPALEPVVSEPVVTPVAVEEALAEAPAEVLDLAVTEAPVESPPEASVEAAPEASTETAPEAPIKAAVEAAAEAPTEDVAPVDPKASIDNSAPETTVETQTSALEITENESPASGEVSMLVEPAAPAEPSVPEDPSEPVVDPAIATASIPEMPPLSPVVSSAQADGHPAPGAETAPTTAPAETVPPAETPCPTPALDTAAELIPNTEVTAPAPSASETQTEEVPEAPPASVTLEPAAESVVPLEGPVADSTPGQSEAPSAPAPAADPAPEPSSTVASANETSQDTEGEKAIKED